MEELKAVPYEYQVFALSFKEKGAISQFKEALKPEEVGAIHGQQGLNQFYLALLDFHNKTGLDPVDPIAFKSWLENETDIGLALGGSGPISVFLDVVDSLELSSAESVIQVLTFRANKRRQIDYMQELQGLLGKKEFKDDVEKNHITELVDKIKELENEIGYDPMDNVVTGHDIAKRSEKVWDLPDFIPTKFKSLNKVLAYTEDGGMVKGAVYGVIAASGLGKSTFCRTLMNDWVDKGYSVLFVNYEEAQPIWETSLFSQIMGKNIYKEAAKLDDLEKETLSWKFAKKMEEWGDRFNVKHDPDTPYFEDLEIWLKNLAGHGKKPDVIIIDTIQSMFIKGSGGKPRWGQFEEMMVRLEKLAKQLDAVMIITAQENTNRMKEGREVVQQSDAGGSITIVQKCSVTIFITPKKLLGSRDDSIDDSIMQLQIPKNRITGAVFTNDPPMVRYNDDCKTYEEYEPWKEKGVMVEHIGALKMATQAAEAILGEVY